MPLIFIQGIITKFVKTVCIRC